MPRTVAVSFGSKSLTNWEMRVWRHCDGVVPAFLSKPGRYEELTVLSLLRVTLLVMR